MTGSNRKPASNGVSRPMLIVIALILLLILLPTALVALPLSRLEVTVTNVHPSMDAAGYVTIGGMAGSFHSLNLVPGQKMEISCGVSAGAHEVTVSYWFPGESQGYYYNRHWSQTIQVPFFGSESVSITLTP